MRGGFYQHDERAKVDGPTSKWLQEHILNYLRGVGSATASEVGSHLFTSSLYPKRWTAINCFNRTANELNDMVDFGMLTVRQDPEGKRYFPKA